jgi:hypothetical protein
VTAAEYSLWLLLKPSASMTGAEPMSEALPPPARRAGQEFNQASRSALIVGAWVVIIPCGNPW